MIAMLAVMAVLNQDCSEFQAKFPAEKMTVEGARECFDRMNMGGNTHLFINPQAHNASYPTKAGRQTYEFEYPVDALLDWDNYVRIDPFRSVVTLLGVDLALGRERAK